MSVKEEIIRVLEMNKGESLSGEALASQLGVSRSAVWKAMQHLRQEGYPIEAVTNKGYALRDSSDLLSEQGIRLYLGETAAQLPLYVYKTVDSTNSAAKRLAMEEPVSGALVAANEQTKGRGRLGRDFYSPASSGIYLTLLLKPSFDLSKSVLTTTAASVAVCRAIQKVSGAEAQIKWVNDVYLDGKKICGILTEAITDFESGAIDYIATGIGINCQLPPEGFPEELRQKAGVLPASVSRNQLAAEVVNELLAVYQQLESRSFLEEYKSRSLVLGREIDVIKHYSSQAGQGQPPQSVHALALDIDRDGGLLVEYENGTREVLNTGEISIRL
ncbi:biotin--[acetyl-CoA-carboxylase] ligase [Aminipila butyrica]|uniref:Bifunctional ligase/repressor BirA n=1 Tax=Aminipila butyrica TaxID=433296 RepID=A0A858BZG5_9FIRM|nr:biotin--[acetyl-CoA-carboxylase] ligase [Aminipila butyrica]QIB70320.1 biotin--[acetyl-CoA-carboxylase] ligase [Aminipila butyrica]